MAIIEMRKLRLLGLNNDRLRLLDAMHKIGCVEIVKTSDCEDLPCEDNTANLNLINEKLLDTQFAISFLEEKKKLAGVRAKKGKDENFKKEKKPFFAVRREISYEEFALADEYEFKYFEAIDTLKKYNERQNDLRAEKAKQFNLIEQYSVFSCVGVPFDEIKSTKSTTMFLGTYTNSDKTFLENLSVEFQTLYIEKLGVSGANDIIFVACHTSEYDELIVKLMENGFSICSLKGDKTASEIISLCRDRIHECNEEIEKIDIEALSFNDYLEKFKLLYDYYCFQKEKTVLEGDLKVTSSTFIIEGWVPKEQEERFAEMIEQNNFTVYYNFSNPAADEDPPVCMRNKKLVSPYESVTNMYSSPNYRETDPNLFVAMFFFLFFGMMLSDAGYGLVLAIGGFLLLKLVKMENSMRKMIGIITMCGVSTLLWGITFGGWFGVTVSIRWFSPLEEPIMMLGLCLGLGLVHILTGMGIRAYYLIKHHKKWDAIWDIGSWYIFFIGLIFVVISMLAKIKMLQTVGIIIAGVGLAVVVFTNGRREKKLVSKIVGGFKGLYGIINYMSDILSYARLFGLGLATGVIGMVFNTIAAMFFDKVMLIPFGIIVLLIGHTFNIAINVLGAYVHTCRLHYIEFFSRFYEGGGKLFRPIGSDFKYVNIVGANQNVVGINDKAIKIKPIKQKKIKGEKVALKAKS